MVFACMVVARLPCGVRCIGASDIDAASVLPLGPQAPTTGAEAASKAMLLHSTNEQQAPNIGTNVSTMDPAMPAQPVPTKVLKLVLIVKDEASSIEVNVNQPEQN